MASGAMLAVIEEMLMNPLVMPESANYRKLREKIEAIGGAHALLTVLAARGFTVTAETRARVESCHDRATLTRWLTRAATASSIDHVFADAGHAG